MRNGQVETRKEYRRFKDEKLDEKLENLNHEKVSKSISKNSRKGY